MSASGDKTKAEQRARTRRNQQRCRERKRAHIEELERQVDALQAKIRQCEPCPTSCLPEHESALDTALRENAARRDLLSALGFDEEAQQRFIASDAKRQVVRSILDEDGQPMSPPQTTSGSHAGAPAVSLRPPNMPSADAATMAERPSNLDVSGLGDAETPGVDWAKIMMDYEQAEANLNIDEWLLSDEALDIPPLNTLDTAGNELLLDESHIDPADPLQGAVNDDTELGEASTTRPTVTKTLSCCPPHSVQNITQLPSDQAVDRCFLDTVVQTQAGEASTLCSQALSMIFRHNRKGLSMAALQDRLRPGIRLPSEGSRPCRVENSVLFKVLAEISV